MSLLLRGEEHSKLWSVPINGGSEKPLFDFNDKVDYARVSPDGSRCVQFKKDGHYQHLDHTNRRWRGEAANVRQRGDELSLLVSRQETPRVSGETRRRFCVAIVPSGGGTPTQLISIAD